MKSIFRRLFGSKPEPAPERTALIAKLKAEREQLALPSVALTKTGARGFSKFGGHPNLPADAAWPIWNGVPLGFVAQIDLAELAGRAPAWMPSAGRLYFFYDLEQGTWGFDPNDRGSWRVLYSQGDPGPIATPPAPRSDAAYAERQIGFEPCLTRPSYWRIGGGALDLTEHEMEQLGLYAYDAPGHRLFGYPDPIQGDEMELECQLAANGVYVGTPEGYRGPTAQALRPGAADWSMLLQLDSDDDLNMCWGDVGTLYFWVRREDARKGDFSNVWMVLQCT